MTWSSRFSHGSTWSSNWSGKNSCMRSFSRRVRLVVMYSCYVIHRLFLSRWVWSFSSCLRSAGTDCWVFTCCWKIGGTRHVWRDWSGLRWKQFIARVISCQWRRLGPVFGGSRAFGWLLVGCPSWRKGKKLLRLRRIALERCPIRGSIWALCLWRMILWRL